MNKRLPILLMSLLLVIFTLTTTVKAEEAIVTTDNLNLRSGPGTDFDTIGQVHTDETYQIVQKQNEWVEIEYEDKTGWITTEYITVSDNSSSQGTNSETDESNDESAEVNDSPANGSNGETITMLYDNTQIRNGPSTDDDIIYFSEADESFKLLSEDEDWYEIKNDEVTGYVLKQLVDEQMATSSPGLKNKTIVLDAGHGGRDVGAIGASGSFEKDFTYATTMELQQELIMLGAEVILTRDVDDYVSLGGRTSLANVVDTDAFISIHYNSTPELPQVTGIGTYYYHDQNKTLARAVQRGVIRTTDAKDRGVAFENFHVVRQTFKPSILIELGFLSNQEEEELLKRNPYQKKIVTGIVNGLQTYFNQ